MSVPLRASLMITCLGDIFFPEIGVSVVRLLRRLGVAVDFPSGQTCCGLPLFNSGYREEAARVARRTIPLFAGSQHVVVPSGSCAWMVKKEYPELFRYDPAMLSQAESLAARTWEFSQFLVKILGATEIESTFGGKVAYHDSCHLLRGLAEAESPRTLLKKAKGIEMVELTGAGECCGFGGSFSVRLPEVSASILDKKLSHVEGTGADLLVACDAGCLMQIGGGLTRKGSRVRAVHLAQLLAGDKE